MRKLEQTSRRSLLEIDHLNQTNSVQYNVQGWTKLVRMASGTLQLQALWHNSSKYVVTAQCTLVQIRGLGIACRLSVCLSVCDVGDL